MNWIQVLIDSSSLLLSVSVLDRCVPPPLILGSIRSPSYWLTTSPADRTFTWPSQPIITAPHAWFRSFRYTILKAQAWALTELYLWNYVSSWMRSHEDYWSKMLLLTSFFLLCNETALATIIKRLDVADNTVKFDEPFNITFQPDDSYISNIRRAFLVLWS